MPKATESLESESVGIELSHGEATKISTQNVVKHDQLRSLVFYLDLIRDLDLAHNFQLVSELGKYQVFGYELGRILTSALSQALDRIFDYGSLFTKKEWANYEYQEAIKENVAVLGRGFLQNQTTSNLVANARQVEQQITGFRHNIRGEEVKREIISYLNMSRLLTKSIILLIETIKFPQIHRLILNDNNARNSNNLTPTYLATIVLPYIDALIQIQHTIDGAHGRPFTSIEILAIRHGSVTVDITGGIRDTVELVMDLIVPYRRETKRRQAELDVASKEIEVKQKEADLKKAQATMEADSEQANVDVEKAQAKVALLRQQERELALKNKKQELELFELTLAMVDKIKADLPDSERLYYATKLLDPTRLIAASPLELISAEPIISADGSEDETGSEEKG